MNAKEAKLMTNLAEEKYHQERLAQEKKESDKRKAEDAKYMRDLYPLFEAKVYSDIRKAATAGDNRIIVRDPKGIAWEKLCKKLLDDGYTIRNHFRDGHYENYGDYNAPCNIWADSYWYYEVTW